ncbi:hypothetical protein [uncultured Kordia sp.]|uniref:hypothetical protein n=1 Tax=uncultured Kordia sp. TaxID=507699 RepID=UPI00262B29CF|nr:hypothetical protein [uncultured Kordia sp.]
MKLSLTLFSLLFVGNLFLAHAQRDASKEPKAGLIITINGKKHTVPEGEIVTQNGTTVSVKIADSRSFSNGTISFDYPSNLGFEYEEDFGYKNWMFDGNNFVIMYFEITQENSFDSFVNEIAGRYGKQNCKIEKTSMKLGGRELYGKRINVNLMGERLIQDFLSIPMKDGKTRILAFQDSPDEYGNHTDEGNNVINMVKKTITYKK